MTSETASQPPASGPAPQPTSEVPALTGPGASGNTLGQRLGYLAASGLLLLVGGRNLDVPGLYYDECCQAGPAMDLLTGDLSHTHQPLATEPVLLGRKWPFMTQPYMGAIKDYLLIPSLWMFGPGTEVLRATTLVFGAVGLWLAMGWAGRLYGPAVAWGMGLLLVSDPSFVFISRHDSGSFVLGFVFRAAALWLFCRGWSEERPWCMFLGGLAVGAGLYNKIDFVLSIAAVGLAAGLVYGRQWLREAPERRRLLQPAAWGLAVGLAWTIPWLLGPGGALPGSMVVESKLPAKLHTAASLLDGSYFLRLMQTGGVFNWQPEQQALALAWPGWLMLAALGAALVIVLRQSASGRGPAPEAFGLWATLATLAGVFLMPDASRIRHFMNAYPFPQLVVALLAVRCWRAAAAGRGFHGSSTRPVQAARWLVRGAGAAVVAALCLGGLVEQARIMAEVKRTGGTRFWSDAINRLVSDLDRQPAATVLSLDWGFHEQLAYLTRGVRLVEVHWTVFHALFAGQVPIFDGTPEFVYLAYPPHYQFNALCAPFLDAAASVPQQYVEKVPYHDRTGEVVFYAVRFTRPHRVQVDHSGTVSISFPNA